MMSKLTKSEHKSGGRGHVSLDDSGALYREMGLGRSVQEHHAHGQADRRD